MVRMIFGILAGLLIGMAAIWGLEMINHLIYPIPSDVRLDNKPRLGEYMLAMSAGAQAFVAGGWLLGSLIGGWVAGAISRRNSAIWVIVVLIGIAGVANLLYVPHPLFLQIAAIVAPLLGGLAARALLNRTPSAGMGAPL